MTDRSSPPPPLCDHQPARRIDDRRIRDNHGDAPLSLAMLAYYLDDGLVVSREQLHTLRQIDTTGLVLDEAIVKRLTSNYTRQAENIAYCREQLRRWRRHLLSAQQAKTLARLTRQLDELHAINGQILSLTAHGKHRVLDERSDA